MPLHEEPTTPDYEAFKDKVYRKTGIDLHKYKSKQMMRRINMLVQSVNTSTFCEYFSIIEKDPVLFEKFINHITINVSEFFRNPEQFTVLKNDIIPLLLKSSPDSLKIWSAGCSTGEEPHTLAIIMDEYFPKVKYRILATDLDRNVLSKAQQGLYNPKSTVSVPQGLTQKYFDTSKNTVYQINRSVQRNITFKAHNLLEDKFETDFDLILCRNVVIYFTEETKTILYTNFHKALKPKAILFTGSTEQIFKANEIGFTPVRHFFYQKT